MCFFTWGCCIRGEQILRRCFWSFWFICAFPLAFLVERPLFVAPIRFILTLIKYQRDAFWSAWIWGVVLGVTVFYPLSRLYPSDSNIVCTVYMSVLSYACAHVAVGWLLYMRYTSRWPLYDECGACVSHRRGRKASSQKKRPTGWTVVTLATAGYTGLVIGLISIAFPLIALVTNTNTTTDAFVVAEWCRPTPHLPLAAICIPVFLLGMLKAHAEVDEVQAASKREYQSTIRAKVRVPATTAEIPSMTDDEDDDEDTTVPDSDSQLRTIARRYGTETTAT